MSTLDQRTPATAPSRGSNRLHILFLLVLFAATAVLLGLLSQAKMLNLDEIMVLQTDAQRTLADVAHTQATYPISLDPYGFHFTEHAFLAVLAVKAWVLRLPSMLGFLIAMGCLYRFASRAAGPRAGVVAAMLPLLTRTLAYAVEARPYSLMFATTAASLLAWQIIVRSDEPRGVLWPVLLALLLSYSVNLHFYGIFPLVALGSAEVYRLLRYRKILWAAALPILVGAASVAMTLPVLRASLAFKTHYYLLGVSPRFAGTSYSYFLLGTTGIGVGAFAVPVLILAGAWLLARNASAWLPDVERVALLATAAIPIFAFLIAKCVTHTIEERSTIACVAGITLLLAVGTASWWRSDTHFAAATLCLLALALISGGHRVRNQQHLSQLLRARITSFEQWASSQQLAGEQRIFVSDLRWVEILHVYANETTRSRTVLLYSHPLEIAFRKNDVQAWTAERLRFFTTVAATDFSALSGTHFLVDTSDAPDWVAAAIAQQAAGVQKLGECLEGEAELVAFPSDSSNTLAPRRP